LRTWGDTNTDSRGFQSATHRGASENRKGCSFSNGQLSVHFLNFLLVLFIVFTFQSIYSLYIIILPVKAKNENKCKIKRVGSIIILIILIIDFSGGGRVSVKWQRVMPKTKFSDNKRLKGGNFYSPIIYIM
jgi:hypothetical protein